jgi:hypothetical protein
MILQSRNNFNVLSIRIECIYFKFVILFNNDFENYDKNGYFLIKYIYKDIKK